MVTLTGTLRIVDRYGEELVTGENLIVSKGIEFLTDAVIGRWFPPRGIGVGLGSTAPTSGDTGLENEWYREGLTRTVKITAAQSQCQLYLDFDKGNGAPSDLTEAGLFDSSVGGQGNLLARIVHPPVTKDAATSLTYIWQWSFT